MDALPPTRVTYGDKEIARILERASELQRAAPSRPDPTGLTAAELEEIAREAGIDPQHLRQAVAELDRAPDTSWERRVLGAPMRQRLERLVEGELPSDGFDTLVPILQSGTDGTGHASTVGKALTWSSTGGNNSRRLQILVHAKDDRTLIRLEERSDDLAAALHIGLGSLGLAVGIPGGLAIAGAAGALPGVGAAVVIMAGVWALTRGLYRWSSEKRRLKLQQVMSRLEEAVRSQVGPELPSAADVPTLPSSP